MLLPWQMAKDRVVLQPRIFRFNKKDTYNIGINTDRKIEDVLGFSE